MEMEMDEDLARQMYGFFQNWIWQARDSMDEEQVALFERCATQHGTDLLIVMMIRSGIIDLVARETNEEGLTQETVLFRQELKLGQVAGHG